LYSSKLILIWVECVVPDDELPDKIRQPEFLFEQAESPFNFSIDLKLFQSGDDELLKYVVGKT